MEKYGQAFQRIEVLFDRAASNVVDDFIRAQIAQLICVLASGAIETACQSLLGDHCEASASPRASRYVRKQLAQFLNPNPKKIKDLILAFDEKWASELEEFWEGEIKDSIGSLVRNRHLISHGKPTTVSLGQVKPWVGCAKKFCAQLKVMVEGA
jgi:hypothetical protein